MGHLSGQPRSSWLLQLQTGIYRAARCADGDWIRSVGLASEAIASCKRLFPISSEVKAIGGTPQLYGDTCPISKGFEALYEGL